MLASNWRENRTIFGNARIRNVAADTANIYGASGGFCGAPWHPSVSKKDHFFSRAPGFSEFLKILLPAQPYERSVGLCTHIRAIFAPHSKIFLPGVQKEIHMEAWRPSGCLGQNLVPLIVTRPHPTPTPTPILNQLKFSLYLELQLQHQFHLRVELDLMLSGPFVVRTRLLTR